MRFPLVPILVTLTTVGGMLLLGSGGPENPVSTLTEAAQREPGYAARGASLVQTGADGLPQYSVEAAVMRQLPGSDRVQLDDLQLALRAGDGAQWHAQARHGSLSEVTGEVQLEGDVQVTGPTGEGGTVELATAHLDLDTRQQRAATADPVTLRWSGRRLSAVGLTASLRDQRLRLGSSVHGTFQP